MYAEEIWKGDIVVADVEELKIHARRLNAKDVLAPEEGDKSKIPVRRWKSWQEMIKKSERPSQLGFHSATGKSIEMICREMRTDLFQQDNSQRMTLKQETMFGVLLFWVSHVLNQEMKYVPKERSFPTPLKYFEFFSRTSTTLDVLLECRMDDYWNVDGDRELLVPGTAFTQFTILEEVPRDGCTWSGKRLTKVQATLRPDYHWQKVWSSMSKTLNTKMERTALLKSRSSTMLEKREFITSIWTTWSSRTL